MSMDLLPDSGLICVAEQIDKGFKHYFLPKDQAQGWATKLDKAGKTVFIAQASFLTGESRKGDNAAFVKNFFLDIDCGKEKAYATQRDGIAALKSFLQKTGLPAPAVVSSGNGLYAHFVLDREIPAGIWQSVALLLQKVVRHHEPGLDADGIVADRARVLRPVGATHRKDPNNPKTVTLLRGIEPLNALDFIRQVKTAFEATGEKLAKPKVLTPQQNADFLSGLEVDRPSSAEKIASKCAQVAAFKASKGDVPEPFWYAMIGVLRFCTEGEELIQSWSSGHGDYSREGTHSKIVQHERGDFGPTTCSKLSSEAPGVCSGCRFAATTRSPITLGYADIVPLARTDAETAYPDLPSGFKISETGIYYNDGGEDRRIYNYPLWVSSVNVDHFGESFTLKHRLPNSGWREVTAATNKLTEPKAFFSAMFDAHIGVTGKDNRGLFMSYVETFIEKLRKETLIAKLTGQMGWHSEEEHLAFAHGPEIYRKEGGVQRVGYSVSAPDFVRSMKPQGDSAQWIENTKILNRDGLEGFAFEFLCSAFGSPLVKFTGYDGAMVSIVGESGLGKTLTGKWGLSAWGDPKKLILMRDDTRNALVSRFGVYGNLPAYIDEISNISPEELSDLAYKISQGRDKARLGKNAVEKSSINQWNLLGIVSSNHSLVDKLVNIKADPGGEVNRIFEYEVFEGFTKEEGALIANACENNFGEIGKRYAQLLVEKQDTHKLGLQKVADLIDKKANTTASERFWAMTGAVAIYGGMLAKSAGLCHVDIPKMLDWVCQTIIAMRKYKATQGFNAISLLGSILDRHSSSMLVVQNYTKSEYLQQCHKEPKGSQLLMRVEMDTNTMWVSQEMIKRELQKVHISPRKMGELLKGKGLLGTTVSMNLGRGTLHSSVNQYCWKLDLNNPAFGSCVARLIDNTEDARGVNHG